MRVVLCLGVFFALAIPGTTAAWTDPVAVSGTTLGTGTADLKVNNSDAPTFTAMNASTMEGGDSTAGVLTVKNNGNVQLSYYVGTTATNSDGKNLASQLTVKVTGDAGTSGSSPNVRCAGSALASSGTTFGGALLGSSSNRRTLAAGASETICVQASLPDGTAALGGTTNITFTFTAVTGTTADPGWVDTVTTSGTTLTMITAFYLGADVYTDTKATQGLPLRRESPTQDTLYNWDTDRDSLPGRKLDRRGDLNSNDKNKVQWWNLAVGSQPLTITGTARLRIWSAVKDWNNAKIGVLMAGIYDCQADGTTCSPIVYGELTSDPDPWWTGGTDSWGQKNVTLAPSGTYTFAANHVIQVRVGPSNAGQESLLLAYDTRTYRSALIIDP